jgi:hypothetical protein
MSIKEKILKWWYLNFRNPVIRKGKTEALSWRFRRFWFEASTASGNWKARWTAAEAPYGYLLAGETDENIIGFLQIMYSLGMLLTQDQGLANDVAKAINKYSKRLEKKAASEVVEDEMEEKIALETEKQIQEHVELPKKERRKLERDINGRFKKAVAQSLKEKEA